MMRLRELLFTGFYTGYCPVASGTAGTLLAFFIYYLEYAFFGDTGRIINIIIVLAMIYPSIRLADSGEKFFGKNDPPEIVLDEMMGYWISVMFYPFNWGIALAAFLLFRIADIIKPYPAGRAQRIKGGAGIMMDDYIAGIYTNLAILLILLIFRLTGIDIS